MIAVKSGLFKLGQVVATPGALEALERTGESPWAFLSLHVSGAFGVVSDEDKAANLQSIEDGSRIISAYLLKDGTTKLWLITEAEDDNGNRAATTLLLPDEY
jgi:hypothetical protein